MNAIKDTWRQLVRRRLWPVAVLLVAALVAVPMVLAKAPAAPPATATPKLEDDADMSTFVTLAENGTETERRRVLGDPKDPFEPKALPKAKKSKKADQADDAEPTPTATPEPKPDSGTGTGGGSAPTAPTAPVPTATPAPTVPAFSIRVRFGTTEGGELAAKTVERLSVLPDEENPVLVYRGVEDNGKVAIFELTGKVDAQGDGTCEPRPEDCQYLKLRVGETEFITVTETGTETDAQYQLDLVKIYKKKTKVSAEEATEQAESLAKASSLRLDGGAKLRKRNRYVFDARTGTLKRARGKTARASL